MGKLFSKTDRRKRALLIINYKSGKGGNTFALGAVIKSLAELPYIVTLMPPQSAADLRTALPLMLPDFDLIIALGGDGTVNIVINALMSLPPEFRVPLAIIPAGTTCDYARTLKISLNPTKAVQQLATAKPLAIDVGQLGERYFTYVASFGAFSDISYTTPTELKKKLGHLAYIIEGIKGLSNLTSYDFSVTVDGVEINGRFLFMALSNSRSIGGLLKLSDRQVNIADGEFELLLIRDPSWQFMRTATMAKILVNIPNGNDDAIFLHGSSFHFRSEQKIPWTIDGEYGGQFTDVAVKIHHQAVKIMIPTSFGRSSTNIEA